MTNYYNNFNEKTTKWRLKLLLKNQKKIEIFEEKVKLLLQFCSVKGDLLQQLGTTIFIIFLRFRNCYFSVKDERRMEKV